MTLNYIQSVSEITLVFYEALKIIATTNLKKKLKAIIDQDQHDAIDNVIDEVFKNTSNKLLKEAEDKVLERLDSNVGSHQKSSTTTKPSNKVTITKGKTSGKSEYANMVCDTIPKTINGAKNDDQSPCQHAVIDVIDDHPVCTYHKRTRQTPGGKTTKKDVKDQVKNSKNSKTSSRTSIVNDTDDESESDSSRNKKTSSDAAKKDIERRKSTITSKPNGNSRKIVETSDDEDTDQKQFVADVSRKTKHVFPPAKPNPNKGKVSSKRNNEKSASESDDLDEQPIARRTRTTTVDKVNKSAATTTSSKSNNDDKSDNDDMDQDDQ